MKFLKVVSITNNTGKSGRAYQSITFNEVQVIEGLGPVATRKTRMRNVFAEGRTTKGEIIKADAFYGTLQVGQVVEGSVETYNTTPYNVGGRTVTTWTGIIFSDEGDGVRYVNGQLKTNNACVLDADGVWTAPTQVGAQATSNDEADVVATAEAETEEF